MDGQTDKGIGGRNRWTDAGEGKIIQYYHFSSLSFLRTVNAHCNCKGNNSQLPLHSEYFPDVCCTTVDSLSSDRGMIIVIMMGLPRCS